MHTDVQVSYVLKLPLGISQPPPSVPVREKVERKNDEKIQWRVFYFKFSVVGPSLAV